MLGGALAAGPALSPQEALALFCAHCDAVGRRHRHGEYPNFAAPHAVDPTASAAIAALLKRLLDTPPADVAEQTGFLLGCLLRAAQATVVWLVATACPLSEQLRAGVDALGSGLLRVAELPEMAGFGAEEHCGRREQAANIFFGSGFALFCACSGDRLDIAIELLQPGVGGATGCGRAGSTTTARRLVLASMSQCEVLTPLLTAKPPLSAPGCVPGDDRVGKLFASLMAVAGAEAATWGPSSFDALPKVRWFDADGSMHFDALPMPTFAGGDKLVPRPDLWSWADGKRDACCMLVSPDGLTASKNQHEHDYSAALGSVGWTTGRHDWSLKLNGDTDGVWIGVCTDDVDTARCFPRSGLGSCWYWSSSGEISCRVSGAATRDHPRSSSSRFGQNETLSLSLDMDAGVLTLKKGCPGAPVVGKVEGVVGTVHPFLLFDNGTRATIEQTLTFDADSAPCSTDSEACVLLSCRILQCQLMGTQKNAGSPNIKGALQYAVATTSQFISPESLRTLGEFCGGRKVEVGSVITFDRTFMGELSVTDPLLTTEQTVVAIDRAGSFALGLVKEVKWFPLVSIKTLNGEDYVQLALDECGWLQSALRRSGVPALLWTVFAFIFSAEPSTAFAKECLPSLIELTAVLQKLADYSDECIKLPGPCGDLGLKQVVDVVAGLACRLASICVVTSGEEQDGAAALAGVSPLHVGSFGLLGTLVDGPQFDAHKLWARKIMRPVSMMLESDSLDEAETATIIAMLWHAGVLCAQQDSAELDAAKHLMLSATVDNIVQDARQIRTNLYQQRMRQKSRGEDKGWDHFTGPVVSKAKMLLGFSPILQPVAAKKGSPRGAVPGFELLQSDEVFDLAAEMRFADSDKTYSAIRSVRTFVLSDISASAIKEAIDVQKLRRSTCISGIESIGSLLQAGDALDRAPSKRQVGDDDDGDSPDEQVSLSKRRADVLGLFTKALCCSTVRRDELSTICSDPEVVAVSSTLLRTVVQFLFSKDVPSLQLEAARFLVASLRCGITSTSVLLESTEILHAIEIQLAADGAIDQGSELLRPIIAFEIKYNHVSKEDTRIELCDIFVDEDVEIEKLIELVSVARFAGEAGLEVIAMHTDYPLQWFEATIAAVHQDKPIAVDFNDGESCSWSHAEAIGAIRLRRNATTFSGEHLVLVKGGTYTCGGETFAKIHRATAMAPVVEEALPVRMAVASRVSTCLAALLLGYCTRDTAVRPNVSIESQLFATTNAAVSNFLVSEVSTATAVSTSASAQHYVSLVGGWSGTKVCPRADEDEEEQSLALEIKFSDTKGQEMTFDYVFQYEYDDGDGGDHVRGTASISTKLLAVGAKQSFDIDSIDYVDSDDSDDEDDSHRDGKSIATIARLKDVNTLELVFPLGGFKEVDPDDEHGVGFTANNRPSDFADFADEDNYDSGQVCIVLKRNLAAVGETANSAATADCSGLDLLLASLRSIEHHPSFRNAIAAEAWRSTLQKVVEMSTPGQKLAALELLRISLTLSKLEPTELRKTARWIVDVLTWASPECECFEGSKRKMPVNLNLRRSCITTVTALCDISALWRVEFDTFMGACVGGEVDPTVAPPASHLSCALLLGGSLDTYFDGNKLQTSDRRFVGFGATAFQGALTRMARSYLSDPLCEMTLPEPEAESDCLELSDCLDGPPGQGYALGFRVIRTMVMKVLAFFAQSSESSGSALTSHWPVIAAFAADCAPVPVRATVEDLTRFVSDVPGGAGLLLSDRKTHNAANFYLTPRTMLIRRLQRPLVSQPWSTGGPTCRPVHHSVAACEKALILSDGDESRAASMLAGNAPSAVATPTNRQTQDSESNVKHIHAGDVVAVRVSKANKLAKPGVKGVLEGKDSKGKKYLYKLAEVDHLNTDAKTCSIKYLGADGIFTGGTNNAINLSKVERDAAGTSQKTESGSFEVTDTERRQPVPEPETLVGIPDENTAQNSGWFHLMNWAKHRTRGDQRALCQDALTIYMARHALMENELAVAPCVDISRSQQVFSSLSLMDASMFLDGLSQLYVECEARIDAARVLFEESNPIHARIHQGLHERIQRWLGLSLSHRAAAVQWVEQTLKSVEEDPTCMASPLTEISVDCPHPLRGKWLVQRCIAFPGAAQLRIRFDQRCDFKDVQISFGLNAADVDHVHRIDFDTVAMAVWPVEEVEYVVHQDFVWYTVTTSASDLGASFGYRFSVTAEGGGSFVEVSDYNVVTGLSESVCCEFSKKYGGANLIGCRDVPETFSASASLELAIIKIGDIHTSRTWSSEPGAIILDGKRHREVPRVQPFVKESAEEANSFTLEVDYASTSLKDKLLGTNTASRMYLTNRPGAHMTEHETAYVIRAELCSTKPPPPAPEEKPPQPNPLFGILLATLIAEMSSSDEEQTGAKLLSCFFKVDKHLPRFQTALVEAVCGAELGRPGTDELFSVLLRPAIEAQLAVELPLVQQKTRVMVTSKAAKMLAYLAAASPMCHLAGDQLPLAKEDFLLAATSANNWQHARRVVEVGRALLLAVATGELPGVGWFEQAQAEYLTPPPAMADWKWSMEERHTSTTVLSEVNTCTRGAAALARYWCCIIAVIAALAVMLSPWLSVSVDVR